MTRKSRLRWVIAAVIGVLVVLLLGFLLVPQATPDLAPEPVVVVMDGYDAKNVTRYTPPPPPPPEAQPIPDLEELPPELTEHWEQVLDRADWIDGATVTCDISAFIENDERNVFINMDQGLDLDGDVDVMSRMYSPIQGGRITFAVREPSGTARLIAPNFDEAAFKDDTPGFETTPLRIRWDGATPGSTVACNGLWAEEKGTLHIRLSRAEDPPMPDLDNPRPSMPLVLRGCGFMVPAPSDDFETELAAGRCALQVETRNQSFPFISARSEPIVVEIRPGQTTTVDLVAPPEPPLYQAPDLIEMQTAADLLAFTGSDAAADALDELVQSIIRGEWDGEDLAELMREMGPGDPIEDVEFDDEVIIIEEEDFDGLE